MLAVLHRQQRMLCRLVCMKFGGTVVWRTIVRVNYKELLFTRVLCWSKAGRCLSPAAGRLSCLLWR